MLSPRGYRIGVEDHLMDVTVPDASGSLLWHIESKETSKGLTKLPWLPDRCDGQPPPALADFRPPKTLSSWSPELVTS
jgi:hypothetical protein